MKKSYDHEYIAYLVEQCRAGNSNAFAELYGMTYDRVYNYACNYLRDRDLAQDALQEIYIQVLKNIGKLRAETLFIAWLNQICFHVCYHMSQAESEFSAPPDSAVLAEIIEGDIDNLPEKKAIRGDVKDALQQALARLPDVQYQVVVLRFWSEMKIEDIADTLGISRSSVKRHLASARESLKGFLEKAWQEGNDFSEYFT